MRGVVVTEPGGPEVLRLQEVPDPVPGPGEVLVEVAAAGVNRADLLQRQGGYPPPPGASPLPGLECSGRVLALGEGVTGHAVGDQVCALLAGGGYAERVAVPAAQLLPVPRGVDLVDAAGLPEAVCTVWSNLFMAAGLQRGETLLVHGGASGIGTTATQLAKALGARVLVTVGSAAKADRCRALGADVAVNYRTDDFVEQVRRETAGRGADVILDIIGAAYLARNLEALATEGRLVVIGLQQGSRGEIDLGLLLRKRAAVLASGLRGRPVAEKAAICRSVVEHVWPVVADGHLRPVVDRVLPLAEAARAHEVMAASEHVGKILLTP